MTQQNQAQWVGYGIIVSKYQQESYGRNVDSNYFHIRARNVAQPSDFTTSPSDPCSPLAGPLAPIPRSCGVKVTSKVFPEPVT